jgi:eukaryotic-like serine/threonine-protein kinase
MYGIAGLLTGRTLGGRYRIDAVVGRGGMGAVYRATDERLGRAVAVKVVGIVAADPAEHARLHARFQREARAAASLHHPNVVAVHDFGSDEELGLDFLVMELLRGEDLAVRLAHAGAPPLHEALSILRQAARGLAAGHRAGLVHRDVKPGNLFLEEGDPAEGPRVRVLDFGIAQVTAEEGTMTNLTEAGRSPFSPAYASPEQFRGEERVTAASDVFSLGAVGYHLVTGKRPFTAGDPTKMAMELSASLRALPDRAPDLPRPVRDTLLRALSLRPADRPRDGAAMAAALGGDPADARGAYAATPPQRARVPAHAGAVPIVEDADDATQLFEPTPPRADARAALHVQGAFAPPPPVHVERPQPAPAASDAPARPGAVGRFFRAAWELTLTALAMALFVGAWALALSGVLEGDPTRTYGGAAASIAFTPWAVHRLTGRGRYGPGLLGAGIATGAAVYYVGTDGDPAILLAAIFGVQVLVCFLLSLLTPRQRPALAE